MKKRFILPLTFLVFLCSIAFVSCTTTMPFSGGLGSVTLESRPYKVLGTVTYEGSANILFGFIRWGGATYEDLLKKAHELYPKCDAVVNVVVDREVFTVGSMWQTITYKMSGTAIRFTDKKQDDRDDD